MITSPRNPQVQRARSLHRRAARERAREFLVEGVRGIREALAAGAPVPALFVEAQASSKAAVADMRERVGGALLEVSPAVMKAISLAATPPGAVAVTSFVDRSPRSLLAPPPEVSVVLADVRDPGNVGTILRTAWAAGAGGVFLCGGTADPYNPKVVRASAGALFRVPFARGVDLAWLLEELAARGVRRVAADPRSPRRYDEIPLPFPCAFIFGNEAWGLPGGAAEVDERAAIPMREGVDSVNVAVAVALFLFEVARPGRSRR